VDFALTDEQVAIARTAREYLADRYPPTRLAELSDSDGQYADTASWPELARQGWFDPDLGDLERGLLAEESGYALHPVPWLGSLATGGLVPDPAALILDGPFTEAGGRVRGVAEPVADAGVATSAVIVTRTSGVFVVDTMECSELSSVDGLRRSWRVRVDAPGRPLPAAATVVRNRAAALLACEAVGVAQRALDLAVAYAKVRTQFDRPIGAYQAVAHQLADAYAAVELARSLAYRAAWLPDDPLALATATVASRRAAVLACEHAIQVTGGLAVTWEYPLHRWYRRALWLDCEQGDHLAVVATAVLDEGKVNRHVYA